MNATPIGRHPGAPLAQPEEDPRLHDLAREVSRGLQLSRGTALSLTRLQLAIRSGDRQQALAALDRLHALDAELEHLVEALPDAAAEHDTAEAGDAPPAPTTTATAFDAALARHVEEQKLALAFEKLALVSQIGGPGLVSQPAPDFGPSRTAGWEEADPDADPLAPDAAAEAPPLSEWPHLPAVRPKTWAISLAWTVGLIAVMLAMIALGTAAVVMTGW